MTLLFDRYDNAALGRLLEEAGIGNVLRRKGFSQLDVTIAATAVPRIVLRARKDGRSHLLLDAYLRRLSVAPEVAGLGDAAPLELLLVHWVREEDPTAAFAPDRPPLPLQNHPGLGVLRRMFRVALRIATDLGTDGIANLPKFFHDAVIFHRARLFLFVDGHEQGRFEALQRDLEGLALCDATLAVAGWCLRDECERQVRWQPGYQVFPLSPRLTAHFHSPHYAAEVAVARQSSRFRVDAAALDAARAQLGAAPPVGTDAAVRG